MARTVSQVSVADAPPGNWVERLAPARAVPFLQLGRADRPIGAWLLFWPCAWSLGLASLAAGRAYVDPWHFLLFLAGAFLMRAAGCAWNDIVDRHIDASVERTRSRPIPSGRISVRQALAFGVGCSLVGLAILLQFNSFAVMVGIASLVPVTIYPFMKRFTYWPQAVLGLTFKWGALMGWAVTFGRLDLPALVLYGACIAWTIGYDTIYAHQDKEDDALLGLKSTALRFGSRTHRWLVLFYGLALAGLCVAGVMAGAGKIYILALVLAGLHMAWQIATLDTASPANCLTRFRSNHPLGAIVFLGISADMGLRALQAAA
ncbi:MAG: 4-hydroxybenzoate octaprenyltransferase [Hyphomicrobiaceae bacterium]|nr:MAG: 4-hydroxybenzoate octaprenyltransferase [Hyphomicrobiaceae bacterium]